MNDVRVIGVGNLYRRDDAAGLEVARRLRASGIPAVEHDGEPAGLLNLWEGAGTAYVVDAVRGSGVPGRVHRVDVTTGRLSLPAPPRHDSSHALGLGEAVELARALDRLPARLILLGIEGQDFRAGLGLSPEVAVAAERVAREIRAEAGPKEA